MRRLSLLLGLLPALPITLAAGACQMGEPVELGLVLLTPLGLLDEATGVRLSVFDAKRATCESNGHVDTMPSGDGVQHFDLENAGCAGGVGWCKEITLDKDGTEKMFAVVVTGPAGVLGEGCTTAKIDQDPLEVNITVQRYNAPACCDDGEVQVGEQCDLGPAVPGTPAICGGTMADQVCDPSCLAQEVLLSIDNMGVPFLSNGPPGTKSQLAMAFYPGSTSVPNGLHTVFRNNDASTAIGGSDISVRTLDSSLYTVTTPTSLSKQLRLPLLCTDVTGTGIVRQQEAPAIAVLGTNNVVIAYASDGKQATVFDIMLSVQTSAGCADVPPIEVSMTGAEPPPGSVTPDVAGGPSDAALIVWMRGGRALGRIWQTNTLFPSGSEIEIAPNATAVRVAGSASGWVVAYQGSGTGDADGIFTKTVSINAVTGPETPVNAVTDGVQDQPDIAMLEDGRYIVVWRSQGNIHFQRYDAAGMRVVGDQDAPLNTVTAGEQQFPAAAAGVGAFAVAWEDGSGGIAARFAGGSTGFGYNNVTGQNDAFSAAHPTIAGQRRLPAAAIGGAGFVAIGWQDDSTAHPGVYVRRFPLPR